MIRFLKHQVGTCGICGSSAILIQQQIQGENYWRVRCCNPDCEKTTPWVKTQNEALSQWNSSWGSYTPNVEKLLSKDEATILFKICEGSLDYCYPDMPISKKYLISCLDGRRGLFKKVIRTLEQYGLVYRCQKVLSDHYYPLDGWCLTRMGRKNSFYERALRAAAQEYHDMMEMSVEDAMKILRK